MTPAHPRVGGRPPRPGVPWSGEPDPHLLASVRGRPADRGAADRGDARGAGRTELTGRAADDTVVRASGDRDPRAADPGSPALSVRPRRALGAGGRDRVHRL